MRIRVVLTDLDGTLLEGDGALLPEAVEVWRRLAGEGVPVCPMSSKTAGNNWTDINTGLLNQGILCLAKDDIYLYAGTTGGGVIRRGIDNILSVQRISNSIPANFNLEQNYPNPFNPTTTIQFSIPEQTFVKLEIFNSLGEKVSTIVSEELNIGNYKYEWNAENLSSGIYYYKLTAKEFVQTKKLVLLK